MPDAERTAQDLITAGYEPVVAPLLETIFEPNPQIDLAGISALAFTSRNGVRSALQLENAEILKSIKTYCVGNGTAEEATRAGFSNTVNASGDVSALAERILSDHIGGDVLHLSGADVAGDLVGALNGQGINARRAALYRTVAASHLPEDVATALKNGGIDAVLLYSPKTADTFVGLAARILTKALINTHCVCLSEAVAIPLNEAGYPNVFVARKPDAAGLMACLDVVLGGKAKPG